MEQTFETLSGEAKPIEINVKDDAEWLVQLGVEPDEQWLNKIQDCLDNSSTNLHHEMERRDETSIQRHRFFQLLGVEEKVGGHFFENDLAPDSQGNQFIPISLATFVQTMRTLAQHDIHAGKALSVAPALARFSPHKILEKIENLETLGINAQKAINSQPSILGYSVESTTSRVTNLEGLGLDAVKVIDKCPSVLGNTPKNIQSKLDNLSKYGLDAVKVANRFPEIFGLSNDNVADKIAVLKSFGLDHKKIIERCPNIFGYAPITIEEKITELGAIGLDPKTVIEKTPKILGYSLDAIEQKIETLIGIGLSREDVVNVINTTPGLLGIGNLNLSSKLENIERHGLDPATITKACPSVLSLAEKTFDEKFSALVDLGLDPKTVIKAHPKILSYSKAKIELTIKLFDKFGYWQDGFKDLWNEGEQLSILTTPVETLILWFGDEEIDTSEVALRSIIRKYSKEKDYNDPAIRKNTLREKLAQRKNTNFIKRLGELATIYRNEFLDENMAT